MSRIRRSFNAFILALLLHGIAHADGVIRDGIGPISVGRGGTNLAFADNGAVLMDNPAGIVNVDCCGLGEVGIDVLFTDLHYSDPNNNNVSASNDPFPLPVVSYFRKTEDEQFAYGFGVFAPAGFGSVYDLQGPAALPGTRHYKSLGALARIIPGAAYRVNDRLSIGSTLGVGVSHAELEGPYFLQSPGPFQGTPTILDLQATGAALSWSLGLQYQLTDRTMIGVAFQDETRFHLDGNARIDTPVLGQSSYDAQLDLVWPRSVGVGAKHVTDCWGVFSADVIWFDWSHAFEGLDLRLRDPSNPLFAAVIGPTYDDHFPLNWRDTVSVRLGYEYLLDIGTVRMGYVYHRNPIPDGTLTTYIQTTLEHGISVGYGRQCCGYELNFAYQYAFGADRVVGTSDLAGGDFSMSRVETEAHWAMVSAVKRF